MNRKKYLGGPVGGPRWRRALRIDSQKWYETENHFRTLLKISLKTRCIDGVKFSATRLLSTYIFVRMWVFKHNTFAILSHYCVIEVVLCSEVENVGK